MISEMTVLRPSQADEETRALALSVTLDMTDNAVLCGTPRITYQNLSTHQESF